jgi:hypothetical protein
MPVNNAVRNRRRALSGVVLAGALGWGVSGCGEESTSAKASTTDWRELSSYTYTLESSEGERSLIGTFEVTVRDGKVVHAVGADESARRVVRDLPDEVPTVGELLAEAEAARKDDADTVDIDRAADGHPTRIFLDWDENAIDDESLYEISDYLPE